MIETFNSSKSSLQCLFLEKYSIILCFNFFSVWKNLYVYYQVFFWLILGRRTTFLCWNRNFERFFFGLVDERNTWIGGSYFPFGIILWIQSLNTKNSILRNSWILNPFLLEIHPFLVWHFVLENWFDFFWWIWNLIYEFQRLTFLVEFYDWRIIFHL